MQAVNLYNNRTAITRFFVIQMFDGHFGDNLKWQLFSDRLTSKELRYTYFQLSRVYVILFYFKSYIHFYDFAISVKNDFDRCNYLFNLCESKGELEIIA